VCGLGSLLARAAGSLKMFKGHRYGSEARWLCLLCHASVSYTCCPDTKSVCFHVASIVLWCCQTNWAGTAQDYQRFSCPTYNRGKQINCTASTPSLRHTRITYTAAHATAPRIGFYFSRTPHLALRLLNRRVHNSSTAMERSQPPDHDAPISPWSVVAARDSTCSILLSKYFEMCKVD
jgi:hypothetical protein